MMKLGKTEVETLNLNGWGKGDILEGDEGYGPDRILITAIGEERFLCRWMDRRDGKWCEETGSTALVHRDWKKVGEDESLKFAATFWGKALARAYRRVKELETGKKEP